MEFHQFLKIIEIPNPYSDFDDSIKKLTGCQQSLLSYINDSRFCVVYKRRQEGVSLAMALYCLWLLVNNPGYTIGFVAHNRVEKEIFRQLVNINLGVFENFFSKLGYEDIIFTPEKHNNNFTLLPNSSRINYWTKSQPDAGKGFSLDFVYISEITLNDNYNRLIQSLLPCLAYKKYSRFVITTTDVRNLKEDLFMNGDGIDEYWTDFSFDGKRRVLFEKKGNHFIKCKF